MPTTLGMPNTLTSKQTGRRDEVLKKLTMLLFVYARCSAGVLVVLAGVLVVLVGVVGLVPAIVSVAWGTAAAGIGGASAGRSIRGV